MTPTNRGPYSTHSVLGQDFKDFLTPLKIVTHRVSAIGRPILGPVRKLLNIPDQIGRQIVDQIKKKKKIVWGRFQDRGRVEGLTYR